MTASPPKTAPEGNPERLRASLARYRITEIVSGDTDCWASLADVPLSHRWAFEHIAEHDCGNVCCGKTVYEVLP